MSTENENPFLSPLEKGSPMKAKFLTKRRFLFWTAAAVICFLLIAMFTPIRRGVPETARRSSCQNHLRQMVLALHKYESKYGSFPPAYTVDENGKPLHSWRTLILPFLEYDKLYESIDLTKPWDDPVNEHARKKNLDVYRCPSVSLKLGFTTYLANAWEQGAFSSSKGRSFKEFKDGTSNTIMLLEVPREMAVEWMSPYDVDPEAFLKIAEHKNPSGHRGVANVGMADGSAHSLRFFDPQTSVEEKLKRLEELKSLLTIDGSEKMSLSELSSW